MGYTLRQVETERKFCQSLTVEALERAVPLETIKSVLQQQGAPELPTSLRESRFLMAYSHPY